MRLRLFALIALVLGLSRMAFPAAMIEPHNNRDAVRPAMRTHKARSAKAKVRPRPVRRQFALPKMQRSTPLLPAPDLKLALVVGTIEAPLAVQVAMTGEVAAQPTFLSIRRTQLAAATPSAVTLVLRISYWSAERAAGASHSKNTPRVVMARVNSPLMAMGGDPRFGFGHRQATARVGFRI